MVKVRFPTIIATAVVATGLLPWLLWKSIIRLSAGPPWWLEVVAWCLITCTYVGFVPAELLGPRRGFQRLVDRPWTIGRLYLSVYASLAGAILGLCGLWLMGVGGSVALPAIALVLVIYHFLLRHFLTEAKGTPHLGQRGGVRQKSLERLLGDIGDGLLLMTLALIYGLTRHPIWLFGLLILGAGYMLGVRLHRLLDPVAHSATSYLAVLGCMVFLVLAVIRFAFLAEISRLDTVYANAFLAALLGVTGLAIQARSIAASLAGGGLALGTLYGLLVSNDTIPTSFGSMLLKSEVPKSALCDYALFLFVACCALNVFLANLRGVYDAVRSAGQRPAT